MDHLPRRTQGSKAEGEKRCSPVPLWALRFFLPDPARFQQGGNFFHPAAGIFPREDQRKNPSLSEGDMVPPVP